MTKVDDAFFDSMMCSSVEFKPYSTTPERFEKLQRMMILPMDELTPDEIRDWVAYVVHGLSGAFGGFIDNTDGIHIQSLNTNPQLMIQNGNDFVVFDITIDVEEWFEGNKKRSRFLLNKHSVHELIYMHLTALEAAC